MPKIFISYRRADSRKDAGRIYDRLVDAFDKDNIFKDVDNIPIGDDFRGVLTEAVNSCDVVLAIIGPAWLTIADKDGKRRLDNPADFVRIEIQSGLQRGGRCLVIPVLVDNAAMPGADDLPLDLRELAFKNAITVRDDPDFHSDVDRLIRGLQERYGAAPKPEPVVKPAYNVQAAIARFYTLFDERNWEEARTLLVEIRTSGRAPRVFNIDSHEKEIWAAIEAEERDQEYDVLRMMAARPKPLGIWEALQKFWDSFPNHDPDNLARFQPLDSAKNTGLLPSQPEDGVPSDPLDWLVSLVAANKTPSPATATPTQDDTLMWLESLAIRQQMQATSPTKKYSTTISDLTAALLKIFPPPFDWCYVPGGPATLETEPPKTYQVDNFLIAKYTITNAQFQVFAEAKDGYGAEKDFRWYDFSEEARNYRTQKPKLDSTGFEGDSLPRTGVRWYDAVAFSRWLTTRLNSGGEVSLPTEQQWQRAAVGDTGWVYPWGDTFDKKFCCFSAKSPVVVTEYANGASPFGVVQMSGNVWEWCVTDYDYPDQSDIKLSAKRRVLRGGAWGSSDTDVLGAALRTWRGPSDWDDWVDSIGFRCVVSAPVS